MHSFNSHCESWKLSSAYDLLKSNGFGNEHATSVVGAGNPSKEDMFRLAKEIKYPQKKMSEIINKVYDICK